MSIGPPAPPTSPAFPEQSANSSHTTQAPQTVTLRLDQGHSSQLVSSTVFQAPPSPGSPAHSIYPRTEQTISHEPVLPIHQQTLLFPILPQHELLVACPASTAAREATAEDDTPGTLGRKHPSSGMSHVQDGYCPHGSCPSDSAGALCHTEATEQSHHAEGGGNGIRFPSHLLMPIVPTELHDKPTTEIRAGLSKRPYYIHTALLIAKSPYFAAMQNTSDNPQPAHRLAGPFFFPAFDEFAFDMFTTWIYGAELHGPTDFHTMHHYLCLYIMARHFQVEHLENRVMDLVRKYYQADDMTASPFRLEYIYNNTDGPNMMRTFLISTAAYRSIFEAEKGTAFSDSMAGVLKRGGDLAVDFAQAVCAQFFNDREDVRHGDPCRWHVHTVTKRCEKWAGFEPWESA